MLVLFYVFDISQQLVVVVKLLFCRGVDGLSYHSIVRVRIGHTVKQPTTSSPVLLYTLSAVGRNDSNLIGLVLDCTLTQTG